MKRMFLVAMGVLSIGLFATMEPVRAAQKAPAAAPEAKALVVPEQREEIKTDVDTSKGELLVEKETNLNLQFQLLQSQFTASKEAMTKAFSDNETELTAWIAQVKKAQGWGDDVVFDRPTHKWYRVKKAETKK